MLCSTAILLGHPTAMGYSGYVELPGLPAERDVLGFLTR